MKILVTGAAGMIGSNVAKILTKQGHDVLGVDLKTHQDMRNDAFLMYAVANRDCVFHLADVTTGIDYSSRHHAEMFTNSALLSLRVLEAARVARVREYLYVSSSCVYLGNNVGPQAEWGGGWNPEEANQGYGWAKIFGEIQAGYYARDYPMKIVIARPANVYGPSYRWSNREPHVIPSLIQKFLKCIPQVVVWGSGEQTRTFMHELDCAELLVKLMEKGESGEVYNLGGDELSIAQLANTLARKIGYEGQIIFDQSRPQGPARKAYNTCKLNLLGLKHKIPFDVGLDETIASALESMRLDGV